LKEYIYIRWALITGAVVKLQECRVCDKVFSFGLLKFLLLHCQRDPYVETQKFFSVSRKNTKTVEKHFEQHTARFGYKSTTTIDDG